MNSVLRRPLALLLSALLCAPACASAGRPRYQVAQTASATQIANDTALIASYVKALPIGSRVRLTLTNGDRLRGTLMKVTDDQIVLQENARIPEAPRQLPMQMIRSVEPDRPGGGSVARAIAIGAAVGAGAALGLLVLIAALAYDD
jgi:hypothetical protein